MIHDLWVTAEVTESIAKQGPERGRIPSDLHTVTGRFARRSRMPCTRRARRLMLLDIAPSRPPENCTEPDQPVDAARLEAALLKV
ncbi:MAG: hypothetical protein AAGK93_09835, partial [Pseudomonadota bacterium]